MEKLQASTSVPAAPTSLQAPSTTIELTPASIAQAIQEQASSAAGAVATAGAVAAAAEPEHKKRGRPPKSTKLKAKPNIQKKGIVTQPSDVTHVVELLHDEPDVFKSIFALFFKYKSPNMCIVFYPQYVRFFGTSHDENATIIVDARGSDIVQYYSKSLLQANISSEHIKAIMSNIHPGHSQIYMMMENPQISDKLFIVLTYFKSAREDQLILTPIGDVKSVACVDLVDSTYPIKFELDSGEFKELITDVAEISTTMVILKAGHDPLRIFTSSENGTSTGAMRYSSFMDEKEISLSSSVLATQTFQTSIRVENIKPLMASGVGKTIRISADAERGVIFKTKASAFCEVSVAVKIYKPEP